MCYLYDDAMIAYPQLMTAAWKAESEQEDNTGDGIHVRSMQAEEKDDIMRLSKQIAQFQVKVQEPQNTAISNAWQLSSERDGNRKQVKVIVKGRIKQMARGVTARE